MEIVWMDGGGSWPTSCPDSTGDLGSGERGAEPKREEHGRDGGESGHTGYGLNRFKPSMSWASVSTRMLRPVGQVRAAAPNAAIKPTAPMSRRSG
jgi:hypothetical protein